MLPRRGETGSNCHAQKKIISSETASHVLFYFFVHRYHPKLITSDLQVKKNKSCLLDFHTHKGKKNRKRENKSRCRRPSACYLAYGCWLLFGCNSFRH